MRLVLNISLAIAFAWAIQVQSVSGALSIPTGPAAVIDQYCLDCHDSDTEKGDVNLETLTVDWTAEQNQHFWERVLEVVDAGEMPPAKKKQPSPAERSKLVTWLDSSLTEHVAFGGTQPRRLNNVEFEATVRVLFDMREFALPLGFPPDPTVHGFNNLAQGLTLSPTLMNAYQEVASQLADSLYPPARPKPEPRVLTAGPEDLVLSFSAAAVFGDSLRLASRGNDSVMRSCTWPSRIEITRSGTYRMRVSASQFRPKSEAPMILEVRAREVAASDRTHVPEFRLLTTFPITKESPESVTFEADLYEGQTLLFRWLNAEMSHEPKEFAAHMKAWFERDSRMLAAWQKTLYPEMTLKSMKGHAHLRGMNGWKIITGHFVNPDLDMRHATMESPLTRELLKFLGTISGGRYTFADALCHYYHDNGPSLQLHKVTVEGPLRLVDSPKDKQRYARRKSLFGKDPEESTETYLRVALTRFLPKAFRGPVSAETVGHFVRIGMHHWQAGHSFDEGMHLVLRKVLLSPRFLFRSIGTKETQQHQLAARLSYFLRKAPPDSNLLKLADDGRLSEPAILKFEAQRLMPGGHQDAMVKDFTGQWLDTNRLPQIMPDPKFKFGENELGIARVEVEQFFAAMLRENLPMTDFIDPDFIYTSPAFGKKVYGLEFKGDARKIVRHTIPRGGRIGGLLGNSAIMLTTANGVDTQPVLRGVWVLENIIGMPPPQPPDDVPALTPDVRGATTPREMLAAHTKEASCAGCHKRIDPVGFVLENFDPVGKWRDSWPNGGKIDPSGTLPDGTEIKHVVDFKHWLTEHVELFAQCLSEKLMTYATGRVPNYRERKEIEQIVLDNLSESEGFQDLLLALIGSETFGTQ